MVQRNITVAIIIIVLFVVLAAVGYGIYAIQSQLSMGARPREIDDEDG